MMSMDNIQEYREILDDISLLLVELKEIKEKARLLHPDVICIEEVLKGDDYDLVINKITFFESQFCQAGANRGDSSHRKVEF